MIPKRKPAFVPPATPADEESRLITLQSLDILDTLPEERFDRVTRMSQRLFGVPIALVSLVDEDRQWFKSVQGLECSETPRDISFCGHAILGDDTFVVPDAIQDERFADNPLVQDAPHIRFYAGCPLRTLTGSKLGTLCIIDEKPRNLGEDDLEALQDLASMVERELEAVQWATLDELTRVSNRRGFMMLAQHSLNLCLRQEVPAALVYMDLNNFKPINDTFGHAEGDKALMAFTDLMKTVFRQTDVFARIGGDEFVVLFSNTSATVAEEILAKFQQSLDTYNRRAKRGYDISFSHGIVKFDPEQHESVGALLEDGDAQMYRCKQKGKCEAIVP